MVCSPASSEIATKGMPRQILAAISEKRAGQGEAAIYRREYDVECGRENDHADAISNEADERGAKLRLVRENVARGVGGVARDDERPEQNEVAKNHDGKGEQTGNTCDFCGGPL